MMCGLKSVDSECWECRWFRNRIWCGLNILGYKYNKAEPLTSCSWWTICIVQYRRPIQNTHQFVFDSVKHTRVLETKFDKINMVKYHQAWTSSRKSLKYFSLKGFYLGVTCEALGYALQPDTKKQKREHKDPAAASAAGAVAASAAGDGGAASSSSVAVPPPAHEQVGLTLAQAAYAHYVNIHGSFLDIGIHIRFLQYMPIAYCLMPFAYCLLLIAYRLLLVAYRLLPIAHFHVSTAYCQLAIAYCLLPSLVYPAKFVYILHIVYCQLPITYFSSSSTSLIPNCL